MNRSSQKECFEKQFLDEKMEVVISYTLARGGAIRVSAPVRTLTEFTKCVCRVCEVGNFAALVTNVDPNNPNSFKYILCKPQNISGVRCLKTNG